MGRGRVWVAGAGPGGLTAALALRQVGYEVGVLERNTELRPVGAGLTLQVNAVRMLGAVGVAEAVVAAGQPLGRGRIRRADGRVLSDLDFAEVGAGLGAPGIGIHRAALSDTLFAHLPPGTVRFDARIEQVDARADGVTVRTADGRTFDGDLLVGADGLHSRVRAAVFGDRPTRYAGYTCWRGIAPVPSPDGPGGSAEIWGPGLRFGLVGTGPSETYWFATANAPAGGGRNDDHHAEVTRRFASFAEPVPGLVAATPPASVIRNDIVDLEPTTGWVSGRVVLIGDAAHATTPNMGQGACMAIEDAVALGAALSRGIEPGALAAWEAERTPRAHRVVRRSWTIGRVGQLESAPLTWLRDTMVRLTPASTVARGLRELWDVPVPELVART